MTALLIVAQRGTVDSVNALLPGNPDLNAQDDVGCVGWGV